MSVVILKLLESLRIIEAKFLGCLMDFLEVYMSAGICITIINNVRKVSYANFPNNFSFKYNWIQL